MATLQKDVGKQKLLTSAISGLPTKAKSQVPKKVANSVSHVSEEERRQMIARNAYFRAQRRSFCPGEEANDWLAAEAEIDAMLGKAGNLI